MVPRVPSNPNTKVQGDSAEFMKSDPFCSPKPAKTSQTRKIAQHM